MKNYNNAKGLSLNWLGELCVVMDTTTKLPKILILQFGSRI
jgi:hypothetical protein